MDVVLLIIISILLCNHQLWEGLGCNVTSGFLLQSPGTRSKFWKTLDEPESVSGGGAYDN